MEKKKVNPEKDRLVKGDDCRHRSMLQGQDGGEQHSGEERDHLGSPTALLLSLETYAAQVALGNHLSHVRKLTKSP